ncbi:MAG TPA: ECF-type sigma factor [Bryobacteraceae bacterium]|nr:ECF-type sigma factor [Bryobacteraceae bacterium]
MLSAAKLGDKAAEAGLFSLFYRDLRRLAHSRLKRSEPCTLLDTTSLVHEAYLRLHKAGYERVGDREHFLAYAASAMRSIVVDFIRSRAARPRSTDAGSLPEVSAFPPSEREILGVDEALRELAGVNERMVKIVEMRYFAGMKAAEIAAALSVTERTVRRDWEKARMVLAAKLK